MPFMTGLRSYEDPCGIARALDVIGERWALLVVRELLLGPKRFSDLRAALGASPNVLAQRLAELEACGVVEHRRTGGAAYELTPWGAELRPLLLSLGRWGARSAHGPDGELGVDALLIALESTYAGTRAPELAVVIELRIAGERYKGEISAGELHFTRTAPRAPAAVISADAATLRAVAFGGRALDGSGIVIEGDARLARQVLRSFARPRRAAE